ncbi:MAG: HIT domain-containing protein [Phycisphaerae bacterium]|nr:HIT domain-containing protein [Phycisphaerae bacterium]MDW8262602.1 HIT domain-containing protein [Phycisphaerales bacterium]
MNTLHAPWRMDYIRSLSSQNPPKPEDCFLCQAVAAQDDASRRQRLLLWCTPWTVVVMNKFPYTNGHLLVAPRSHKAEPEELSPEEMLDMQTQTVEAIRLLRLAMSPQGFNLGMNLGRCAGAGLPGHLHQHIVPRWNGDVNFMSIVGEVRIVPQALEQLYDQLESLRRGELSRQTPAAPPSIVQIDSPRAG